MNAVLAQLTEWGYASPEAALDSARVAHAKLIDTKTHNRIRVPVPIPGPVVSNLTMDTASSTTVMVVADFFVQWLYAHDNDKIGGNRLVGRILGTDFEKVY